jgi:hypothetical protein
VTAPVSDDDFHGWRIGGKALHVGELPGRKQRCLYVLDGSTIRTLAFFADEAKAREAMDMLDRIANATGVLA